MSFFLHGIDDADKRIERQDAFWSRDIIDRPIIAMAIKDSDFHKYQDDNVSHSSIEERWVDSSYQAELTLHQISHTKYFGDALPIAYPNLGPDFFASCYGGSIRFSDETSWIEPIVEDWEDFHKHRLFSFNKDSHYFVALEKLYNALHEINDNRFFIGWPDLHPGADCLVGLRGVSQLSFDLLEEPEAIKKALPIVEKDFLWLYDYYYQNLVKWDQPCTGWPGIVSTERWHVPSNDFSCMISQEMFEAFFIESLTNEMRHVKHNLYHLDGPGALRHLDLLLEIKELDAIQWVFGAGGGQASDYIEVYQKIQNAGKGIQMPEVYPSELDLIMENLDPKGVWMRVFPENCDQAESIMKKISKWTRPAL